MWQIIRKIKKKKHKQSYQEKTCTNKASSVAIFNPQSRLLLVRRSSTAEWMPLHYCFPGGHAEKDENSIDAAEREVYEETGIELNKSNIKLIETQINNGYVNSIFVSNVDNSKVLLNDEHDEYIWADYDDCKDLNLVPKLSNFIKKLKNHGYFE